MHVFFLLITYLINTWSQWIGIFTCILLSHATLSGSSVPGYSNYMLNLLSINPNPFTGRPGKAWLLHMGLFMAYLFFRNSIDFSKYLFISFYVLLIVSFLLSRFTGTALQAIIHKNFGIRKAVAILDINHGGLKLAKYLEQQSSLNFVGFLDDGISVSEQGGTYQDFCGKATYCSG